MTRRQDSGSPTPPPVGPLGATAMGASLLFLLAGVIWPHMAGSLLRALLVVLVLIWVAYRAYRTELPAETALDRYSPFDGFGDRPRPPVPDGLRKLEDDLRNADDPVRGARTIVPSSVAEIVREAAEERLAERLGLEVERGAHHPAIRARLDPLTWLLVAPPGAPGAAPALPAAHETVTLDQLDPVLDDLEAL